MARYKEYKKGNILGSIRMFGHYNSPEGFWFEYICVEDINKTCYREDILNSPNKLRFNDPKDAENYMLKLGYKED